MRMRVITLTHAHTTKTYVPNPSFLLLPLLKMSDARPKLNELALELKTLKWADVISIAIQLNVQFTTLQRIAEQHSDINTRVLEAMNCWLEADTTASWKKLASALKSIEKMVLAQKIEDKYINQPTPPSDSSQPQTSRLTSMQATSLYINQPTPSYPQTVRRRPRLAGECISNKINLPILSVFISASSQATPQPHPTGVSMATMGMKRYVWNVFVSI